MLIAGEPGFEERKDHLQSCSSYKPQFSFLGCVNLILGPVLKYFGFQCKHLIDDTIILLPKCRLSLN